MKAAIAVCFVCLFVLQGAPAPAAPSKPGKFAIVLQQTNSASDNRKYSIAFSPDNASVAMGGMTMDVWSTKGYLIRNVPRPDGSSYNFALLQFSRDGKEVVFASRSSKIVSIYDVAAGKVVRTIALGTEGNASCLALSRDGATLAIGTSEGAIELWDYYRNRLLNRIQVTGSNIGQLAFLGDGKRMVYGSSELFTIVRSAGSVSKTMNRGEIGFELGIIDGGVRKGNKFAWRNMAGAETFSFSPGQEIIAVHDKKTIWVLDRNFTVLKTTGVAVGGRSPDISSVLLSPDGAELAVITAPTAARMMILALPELSKVADYDLGEHREVNASYTPDSRFIALAGYDSSNRFIDPHTGTLHMGLYKSADMPVTADISPDGKYVASGGSSVSLWPIEGGPARAIPSQFLSSKVILAPDGRHIVVSRSYGIEVTELDSGESKVFETGQLSPLALSPDGRRIVYMPPWSGAPSSMRLKVCDIVSGKVLNDIPVSYCPVEKVAFSSSGRFLVWGRGLYDLKTNKLVTTYGSNVVDVARTLVAVADYGNNVTVRTLPGRVLASVPTKSRPTMLRFTPDEKTLAVGFDSGAIELWSGAGFLRVKKLAGHRQGIRDIEFSSDGRFLVSSSADSTTKVWSMKNYSSYTRFSGGGEWLIYTPDGYFDASPRGQALAAMISGVDVFSLEQFAARNNRPDMILGRMGLGSPEQISHYKALYLKRLKKQGLAEADLSAELHAPEAKITSTVRQGKFLTVGFTLSDTRFPLKSYNIFVNNVPLLTAYGSKITGAVFNGSERIELASGKNKIEISATNSAGAESYRAQAYAEYGEKLKGNLYYLAFGVSKYVNPEMALNYADKDAKDLEGIMLGMRPKYDGVFSKVFLNSEATAENIKKAKAFLADAKTDDTVVLFAAGHGGYSKGEDPKYYYLPYEAEPEKLEATGVQFEGIEDILDGIRPRKKLFLLDTCDSGELDEDTFVGYYAAAKARGILPRSYRKPLEKRGAANVIPRPYLYEKDRLIENDLSRRTGAIVFSSSRGGEISYESSQIQNGFFTREVITALTTRAADTNSNGRISTKELRDYVSAAVAANTKGLQHPTVDRDNFYQEIELPLP